MRRKKPLKQGKPLARKSPMKRTAKKEVKKKPKKAGPKKVSEKSLRLKMDRIAGAWFRDGAVCAACGEGSFECNPVIQWCHIVRRGCRLIRHDPLNAIPMCKSHHVWFTHRPELWHTFIERKYPGRLQFLVDLDRSRRGWKLIEAYELYEKWYKGRTDCFRTWDGEVD